MLDCQSLAAEAERRLVWQTNKQQSNTEASFQKPPTYQQSAMLVVVLSARRPCMIRRSGGDVKGRGADWSRSSDHGSDTRLRERETNRQTDIQTNRQTETETESTGLVISTSSISRLFSCFKSHSSFHRLGMYRPPPPLPKPL